MKDRGQRPLPLNAIRCVYDSGSGFQPRFITISNEQSKQMKPLKGSHLLRKGRKSIKEQQYLITTTVHNRKSILNQPETAQIILSSLHWLESQKRIVLYAAVIMPDHLHLVAALRQGSLSQLMCGFKSYTAKEINSCLNRQGKFWQPQYHDHALRKDEDLNKVVLYTLNNPVRARLVDDFHEYPYWYCRWDV